jgi:hypothetical protein
MSTLGSCCPSTSSSSSLASQLAKDGCTVLSLGHGDNMWLALQGGVSQVMCHATRPGQCVCSCVVPPLALLQVRQHPENAPAWRLLGTVHAENDDDRQVRTVV